MGQFPLQALGTVVTNCTKACVHEVAATGAAGAHELVKATVTRIVQCHCLSHFDGGLYGRPLSICVLLGRARVESPVGRGARVEHHPMSITRREPRHPVEGGAQVEHHPMSITRREPRHPVGRGALVEHHPMSITRREPRTIEH